MLVVHASNHIQVISPGRSGTKWLSTLSKNCTNSLVCHATRKTLSQVSYLYHNGEISKCEALGAYRFSRSQFLYISHLKNIPFLDFDCKNSPLSSILAENYKKIRFLIMIREPIAFIKSGINRDYFTKKDPASWGHIHGKINKTKNNVRDQIYNIASMWKENAKIADHILQNYPSRAVKINSTRMFTDYKIVDSIFEILDIPLMKSLKSSDFNKALNANRKNILFNNEQNKILKSNDLMRFCLTGLSDDLLNDLF